MATLYHQYFYTQKAPQNSVYDFRHLPFKLTPPPATNFFITFSGTCNILHMHGVYVHIIIKSQNYSGTTILLAIQKNK